jgi:fumiquinazoline A oxidase
MLPWTEIIPKAYFGLDGGACAERRYVNAYTTGLKQTDVATMESWIADLHAFSSKYLDIRNNFVIHRWPQQAVLAVPDDETTYPYRDLKIHMYVFPSLAVPSSSSISNYRK